MTQGLAEQLSPEQISRARATLYVCVADAIERGPTNETLPVLRSWSGIELPAENTFDADAFAAANYSLFGRNIVPYASAFVEHQGQLGGSVAHRFAVEYLNANWTGDSADFEPDHFGTQFRFLSYLSEVEAGGTTNGNLQRAALAGRLSAQFIQDYLLVAFPIFVRTVARVGDPFYESLLESTWTVLLDHVEGFSDTEDVTNHSVDSLGVVNGDDAIDIRSYLVGASGSIAEGAPAPDDGPLDLDLHAPKSSIHDIVDYLTSCKRSGLFISQSDITRLGRTYSLPRGFGTRSITLANLIRTAASLDSLSDLVDSLTTLVGEERIALNQISQDCPSAVKESIAYFVERLSATEAMLADMANQYHELAEAAS